MRHLLIFLGIFLPLLVGTPVSATRVREFAHPEIGPRHPPTTSTTGTTSTAGTTRSTSTTSTTADPILALFACDFTHMMHLDTDSPQHSDPAAAARPLANSTDCETLGSNLLNNINSTHSGQYHPLFSTNTSLFVTVNSWKSCQLSLRWTRPLNDEWVFPGPPIMYGLSLLNADEQRIVSEAVRVQWVKANWNLTTATSSTEKKEFPMESRGTGVFCSAAKSAFLVDWMVHHVNVDPNAPANSNQTDKWGYILGKEYHIPSM